MSRPADIERPKAILFDWDNTLVNTWPTIIECYNDTFHALGLPRWTDQEVRDRAHGSLRDHFPKLFGERAGEAEKVFYETFHRIHLERLPGYAPDLNPDEGIWSYLKYRELKNVVCQNTTELRYELRLAVARLRHKRQVIQGCITQAGLTL